MVKRIWILFAYHMHSNPYDINKDILKILSVGGNPTRCYLEACKKTFNKFFLIFTKQHFNNRYTQSDIVSARQLLSHARIKDNFQYRHYIQFAHRICEYFHQCFKCLSDSIYTYNSHWHIFDKTNVSLTVC